MDKEKMVIEKLVVDVFMNNGAENPSQLLLDLSDEMKSTVLPLLEKKLNDSGVNASSEHTVIDSLTIDVFASLNDAWQDEVAKKLAQEIRITENDLKKERRASKDEFQSNEIERSLFEAWTHFARFGVLPNWKRELGVNSIKELLNRLESDSSEFSKNMIPLLKEDKNVFTRSIHLLNDQLIDAILIQDELIKLSKLIRDLPSDRLEMKKLRDVLIQTTFDSFRNGTRISLDEESSSLVETALMSLRKVNFDIVGTHENTINYLSELIESSNKSNLLSKSQLEVSLNEMSDAGLSSFIKTLLENEKVSAHPKRIIYSFLNRNRSTQTWSNFLHLFPDLLELRSDQIEIDLVIRKLSSTTADSVKDQMKEKLKRQEQHERVRPDSSLFIENAGLVLLEPFLPQLFSNLNLLDETNNWKNSNSQIEAMYILHFMVSNEFEATEDQLFLSKLLTGWELSEPIEIPSTILGIDFNEAEVIKKIVQKEQNELLEFIHENWRPMRNASWEGLQRDFLSRSGTLMKTNEFSYTLTVDEGGLDILLPHKNWGISIIKYSWMECMINVEWK